MEPVWDGVRFPRTLGEDSVRARQGLAAAAKKTMNWTRVLAILPSIPSGSTPHDPAELRYMPRCTKPLMGCSGRNSPKSNWSGRLANLAEYPGRTACPISPRGGGISHLLGILVPDPKRHVPLGICSGYKRTSMPSFVDGLREKCSNTGYDWPELEPLWSSMTSGFGSRCRDVWRI